MQALVFDLAISADEYLKVYQGQATSVSVRSVDGSRIQFPAAVLRPFLLHDGVRGRFRIEFDAAHKFAGITRVD